MPYTEIEESNKNYEIKISSADELREKIKVHNIKNSNSPLELKDSEYEQIWTYIAASLNPYINKESETIETLLVSTIKSLLIDKDVFFRNLPSTILTLKTQIKYEKDKVQKLKKIDELKTALNK